MSASPETEPRQCERCDAEIPQGRLKALPETRLCVACSEEVGGEFVYSARMVNLGKAGSLKLNYGGVTIHKHRRPLPRR